MSQNIYDNPDFFGEYSQLPRSVHGLGGAAEWPRLKRLIPDLQGKRVLDLGCGFGWFCRWAAEAGAANVLGLDLSENMLAEAERRTNDASIHFQRANLEALTATGATYDLIFSSLALHYIEDLGRLLKEVRAMLVPDGCFVFSTEHPVFTAPSCTDWQELDGRAVWPLNGYFTEGVRITNWLSPGVVKYHRTVGTLVNFLIQCGFAIRHLEDWRPTDDQLRDHPDWARELERPIFLLVSAAASP